MRKMIGALLMSTSLLLTACTRSEQKAAPLPAEPQAASQQRLGPFPSAALPGVAPDRAPGAADQILSQATAAVAALDLSGSKAGYQEFRIASPPLVFVCTYSPGGTNGEVPLLACKFGEFVNTAAGHALFWRDGTTWQAQLYPQAPSDLAEQRYAFFRARGENCPIGCGGEFRVLRQSGAELLAVVDLSGGSTNSNQEVHLLTRDGQQWRTLWVPSPAAFRYSNHPKVSFPLEGAGQFVIAYDDGSSQTWVRQGMEFIQLPVQNGITGQIVTLPDGARLITTSANLPDVSSILPEILGIGAPGGNAVAMAAGNHVEAIRQEEVALPIGKAYLAVVVRGQPAAANSDVKTRELWLIAVRKYPSRADMQLAYAIRGVITGDETRAREQMLELGRHWQLPAE